MRTFSRLAAFILFAPAPAWIAPAVHAQQTIQVPAASSASVACDASAAVYADGCTRAWVYFTDKGDAGAPEYATALENLPLEWSSHAVARRQLRRQVPGLFDERDLAPSQSYVDAVLATGAQLHVQSRWLNAISVAATDSQRAAIAQLPFVDRVVPVRAGRRIDAIVANDPGPDGSDGGIAGTFYGQAENQLSQIGLIALHNAGFTGQGVIVGILDTGLKHTHAAFNDATHPLQLVATHDFVFGDDDVANGPGDDPGQDHHGTWITGVLGAYEPGVLVGGAYNASFIMCKTEDVRSETPIEEDNYVAGIEFAEQHGADMLTSSLGYIDWYTQAQLDGHTAVTTVAVNIATANGVFCCTAAGNEGHDSDPAVSHLIAPADALQEITCGAVDRLNAIASFSSDGPTADGRLKPEVLARGVNTRSVSVDNDTDVQAVSGTSLSTPLVAAAVACLIGAHPDWSVDRMRSQLFFTASDYAANHATDPLFIRGYGIVNALAAHQLVDCNSNGVPDAQDISSGFASDFNHNGVPDSCEGLGDMNCDGVVNNFDIEPFVQALTNPAAYQAAHPNCPISHGDIDGSGAVNNFDIDPFVALLTHG